VCGGTLRHRRDSRFAVHSGRPAKRVYESRKTPPYRRQARFMRFRIFPASFSDQGTALDYSSIGFIASLHGRPNSQSNSEPNSEPNRLSRQPSHRVRGKSTTTTPRRNVNRLANIDRSLAFRLLSDSACNVRARPRSARARRAVAPCVCGDLRLRWRFRLA